MARTANSSPPRGATTSESRNVSSRTADVRFNAQSPSRWPKESLILFRPSTSIIKSNIPRPVRRPSLIWRSATAMKPRRLYKPVSSREISQFSLQHILFYGTADSAHQKLTDLLTPGVTEQNAWRLGAHLSQ